MALSLFGGHNEMVQTKVGMKIFKFNENVTCILLHCKQYHNEEAGWSLPQVLFQTFGKGSYRRMIITVLQIVEVIAWSRCDVLLSGVQRTFEYQFLKVKISFITLSKYIQL